MGMITEMVAGYLLFTNVNMAGVTDYFMIQRASYSRDDLYHQGPPRLGYRVYYGRDANTFGFQALPTVFARADEAEAALRELVTSMDQALIQQDSEGEVE